MQFTRKLQTIIFGFSLIPVILIMIISALTFSLLFEPFVRRNLAYDADLFANRVESTIHQEFRLLEYIRDLPAARNLLSSDEIHRGELLAILRRHLASQVSQYTELEGLYVEDTKRNIISQHDPLGPLRSSTRFELTETQRNMVSPLITEPATSFRDTYVMLSSPVIGETGRTGTIIGFFNLSRLREIAREEGMFDSTFRLVLDSNGSIIASSSDESFFWSINDFSRRSDLPGKFAGVDFASSPIGTFGFMMDGKRYTGQYHFIPELGWTVFTSITNYEFIGPVLGMLPVLLIFCLVFIVLLSVTIHRIAGLVSKPVQALVNGMEHVQRHDYRYHIPLEGTGDMQPMIEAFNTLMDHVAHDTHELKRLNKELDTLTTNIPGGLFTCSLERGLPFLSVSEPFAMLCGFNERDSMLQSTEVGFLSTIHEEDRATVEAVIESVAHSSASGSVEYRVAGEIPHRWISCGFRIISTADAPLLFGMAVDATEKHEAYERLRTSDERYRIILDQTDEVIFEWSVSEEHFIFTSREKNWMTMFGRPVPKESNLQDGNFYDMHEDDRIRFVARLKELTKFRLKSTRIEVRLTKDVSEGPNWIWTRFLLTSLFDQQGNVDRIAGRIQDIHEAKTESLRLVGLSQTDGLTALMNRRGFEASVTRLLTIADGQLNHHVLLMLDIDDFKAVNDTHGHAHGDQVLFKIAEHLRQTFRKSDIYGRLGGDEFAVFLVNQSDRETLRDRVDHLLSSLRSDRIFCSIGIACYPEDGQTFTTLYQSADNALYRVKYNGKNGYAFTEQLTG